MEEVFDTIIVGGGPAGLSAALYAVRKSLKVLVIAKMVGGSVALAPNIENYLGFTLISGAELAARFRKDVENFKEDGLKLLEGLDVVNISGSFPNFTVVTDDGQAFKGKAVVIASGRTHKLLGIPGEKEFLGKGVAVCTTCDAPLYKGKDVAVIGGGNSALSAVLVLAKIASSVTLINSNKDIIGDPILLNKVSKFPSVQMLSNHQALEILGDQFISDLKIKNNQSGEEKTLKVQGIFIEIGSVPATAFDKLTRKDSNGAIMVDEGGATSVTGIWAAGDVNNLWGEQMIISAGEGAKTALAVTSFLSKTTH